jgi:hypothetical protein
MSRIGWVERLWIEVDHEALLARRGLLPVLRRMRQRTEPRSYARSGLGNRGGKRRFRLDIDALRGHERADRWIRSVDRGIHGVGLDRVRRAEPWRHIVRPIGLSRRAGRERSQRKLGSTRRSRQRDEHLVAHE